MRDLFGNAEFLHDFHCTWPDRNPSPSGRDGVMRFVQVYLDVAIRKLPYRDSEEKPSYACATAQEI